MSGENSTLNDLQQELKASDESLGDRAAAFPAELLMQLIQQKSRELLENNPVEKVTNDDNNGASVTAHSDDKPAAEKRKNEADDNTDNSDGKEDKQQKKQKLEELKCKECNFKCYNAAELSTHLTTTHGGKKKMKSCDNCSYMSDNTWEMDFHCRSRGHKVRKDESIPCKKCDYMAVNKDDSWVHKKVHIPPEKLFECADCVWCGDRLDNIRYHTVSQGHNMKIDYESIALAKAEEKGPKEVAHYKKKLAKDIKLATKAIKV